MVKVASLKITTSGKNVRVSCGKYSNSFLPSLWAEAIQNSIHHPLLLNPEETRLSKRIFLYRGLGFRLSPNETISQIDQAIVELQRPRQQPVQQIHSNPSLGYIQARSQTTGSAMPVQTFNRQASSNISNDTMVKILLSLAEQKSRTREGDEFYILRIATSEALEIAKRCVSRNVLKTKISRYIPQDTKIAVAIRDGGQCTYHDMHGHRCPAKSNLQYDHRFWPFSLGGTQTMWNLTLKCAEHNIEESNNVDIQKALKEAMEVFFR